MQNFTNDKNSEASVLICISNPESCLLLNEFTAEKLKKRAIVVIRPTTDPITKENASEKIVIIEVTRNVLEVLYGHCKDIYMPILHNPLNQADWPEIVTKDLTEKFNNYLAQIYVTLGSIKGKTLLPLPPHKLETSDTTSDKDKAHIFEGTIKSF